MLKKLLSEVEDLMKEQNELQEKIENNYAGFNEVCVRCGFKDFKEFLSLGPRESTRRINSGHPELLVEVMTKMVVCQATAIELLDKKLQLELELNTKTLQLAQEAGLKEDIVDECLDNRNEIIKMKEELNDRI